MAGFFGSSVGRKIVMSLSGLFLVIFVGLHLSINLTMLFSAKAYNYAAHFMATNPFIKIMEPVLALGFIFHIVYALILEFRNIKSRGGLSRYEMTKRSHQSTWSSRNMIWLGILILAFLTVHIINFYWKIKFGEVPEVTYGTDTMHDTYTLVTSLFKTNVVYDIIYVIGAIALGYHLHHAVWSALQTLGLSNDIWRKRWTVIGDIYAIIIGVGFAIIPLYFLIFNN